MKNKTKNTKYKDSIFRMLFSDKKELLSFYNAVNGSNYEDPNALEINTLDDVIYMTIKNDISFIIDNSLHLYEHQSTKNGNMPLRKLFYVTDLLSGIVKDENLFSSKTIALPNPHFVTFYNGETEMPDRTIQKLSHAYKVPSEEVNLELTVVVLNINYGHNIELMSKCPTLEEYAYYVKTVREYSKKYALEKAIELAIEHCIKNNKLAAFLRTRRDEVTHVSIYEYDAEKHLAMEKKESWDDGKIEGKIEGKLINQIELIRKNGSEKLTVLELSEFMGLEILYIQNIIDLIKQNPEASDEEIAEQMKNLEI